MKALALLLGMVAAVVGCGGDDGPGPMDGGPRPDGEPATDSGGVTPVEIAPPDIPWLDVGHPPVAIAPCPDGWREVAAEGRVTSCEPYPEGGPADCVDGEAHFPGEPGCRPLGSACPTGEWPIDLPADRPVVHVDLDGRRGDGTVARPYLLADVPWGTLATNAVVVLGRGLHEGVVTLVGEQELRGLCAGETLLASALRSGTEGVIAIGGRASVRDLTITTSQRNGIVTGLAAAGTVEGVAVFGAAGIAMLAEGGQLTVRDCHVADTTAGFGSMRRGLGIVAAPNGEVDVARVLLQRNLNGGMAAGGRGSALVVADSAVLDTRSDPTVPGGAGIFASGGGTVTVARTIIERATSGGLLVFAGELTADQVVVRETQKIRPSYGASFWASMGGQLTITRSLLEGGAYPGALAFDSGTVVSLEDVVSRAPETGASIYAFGGPEVSANRVVFEDQPTTGIFLNRLGTIGRFTDVAILGPGQSHNEGILARCLEVDYGASLEANRMLIDGCAEGGMGLWDDGPVLLTDVVVRNGAGRDLDGWLGVGAFVNEGMRLDLTRARFEGNHTLGLSVSNGATLEGREVVIAGTGAAPCYGGDGELCGGHGLFSSGGVLSLTRMEISGNALCGVFLSGGAEIDLMDGAVRDNAIGACIQQEGFDTSRLTNSVIYVDNGTNLQATELPIPELPGQAPEL